MNREPLIPMIAVVTDIRVDTPDVKTFRVTGLDGKKPFCTFPASAPCCPCPGWGGPVFHHLFPHGSGVSGVFH